MTDAGSFKMNDGVPWPLELRYESREKQLYISFDSGESFVLSAKLLRQESPSAEMRGHTHAPLPRTEITEAAISAIEPVGNYAVRIVFADGHRTGIYSWRLIYKLGRQQSEKLVQQFAAEEWVDENGAGSCGPRCGCH